MNSQIPRTINELFQRAVQQRHNKVVMRHRRGSQWIGITGEELNTRVQNLALALRGMGVERGDRVAILAESCPDWSIADYAILATGAVNVPIYPTQTVDQVGFILRNSGSHAVFVSNIRQLRRVQGALNSIPIAERPKVILFEAPSDGKDAADATSMSHLEQLGEEARLRSPGLFEEMSATARPEDLATIIYTSGTTGEPKGVMLTHWNIASNVDSAGQVFELDSDDKALSFLPLSHVFERTVLYIYMSFGVEISFARGVETVGEDIKEVCPTVVTAVPRLFEKIYATINRKVAEAKPLQQKIFHRAVSVGREAARLRDAGKSVPTGLALQLKVLDRLVFTKWRAAVGGRLRFFVSGGAALPPELAYIFAGAAIPILQGYGLTETSPVVSFNRPSANRIGTIGQPVPGVRTRVAEDGELLVQGDNVMQGYYNLPGETEAVLKSYDDGVWFHTGDIVTLDPDGYYRITDRKKDLIKTNLGKYIAPQPIENMIRGIPMVEQVIVIGNARKFPSALIVPSFDALKAYARSMGIDAKGPEELTRHPKIVEHFKKRIDEATRSLALHERIKKIALLDREFSVEGGELTPTLKVRRKHVEEKYRDIIDALYPKFDPDSN